MKAKALNQKQTNYKGFLLDILIYLIVMFAIREINIPSVHFLITGLFWSFTTLLVAYWRMNVRGIAWKEIGLKRQKNIVISLVKAIVIVLFTFICLLLFNIIKDQIPFFNEESSVEISESKFSNLKDNWKLFFLIIPLVLIESFLEELLERGFLLNWLEKLFSKNAFAALFAVLIQAFIFGFRHSYDISERSITVMIIGLIMGIAYVKFGRNLWPLIIAHCILNTISMVGRV